MSEPAIHIENLKKRYGAGDTAVDALKGVDMTIWPGEVVGLVGPSGSGKSTLLKCLGAVIEPTAGRMTLGGQTIFDEAWKIEDLRTLRRDRIGFIFQAPYLIPFLDVTDNVALLPMLAGVSNTDSRIRAQELLAALDVGHRSKAAVSQLSGGEQQRVSIARALANHPPVSVTTQDMADAMNLTQGAIFRHFATKDDIWFAVIVWVRERLMKVLDKAAADATDPLNTIERMFFAHITFISKHPAIPRLLFSELLHKKNGKLRQLIEGIISGYEAKIAGLLDAAKARQCSISA